MAAEQVFEIGKTYRVPTIYAEDWHVCRYTGWLPIMGPLHEDAEHVNFPYQHWHIDWRFASKRLFDRITWPARHMLQPRYKTAEQYCYAWPVQQKDNIGRTIVAKPPELRRMTCKRALPGFPRTAAKWIPALECAYAGSKLKNLRCPHRGIPLDGIAPVDGIVTCPGHGLRWNVQTGELVRDATP